jgi:hypothetical protein
LGGNSSFVAQKRNPVNHGVTETRRKKRTTNLMSSSV